MEVSYILSSDELYTIIIHDQDFSDAGRKFCNEALNNATICDLTGLIEKKLAQQREDELELEPVLKMISIAISKANSAEQQNNIWIVTSPWITLLLKQYKHQENHWKITPVKEAQNETDS